MIRRTMSFISCATHHGSGSYSDPKARRNCSAPERSLNHCGHIALQSFADFAQSIDSAYGSSYATSPRSNLVLQRLSLGGKRRVQPKGKCCGSSHVPFHHPHGDAHSTAFQQLPPSSRLLLELMRSRIAIGNDSTMSRLDLPDQRT